MGTLSTNPYRTLYTWAISKLPSHDIVEKNIPISSGQTLILVKYSFSCYTLFPYATCRGYARWHYIHGSFIYVQPCRLGGWRMAILWLYETGLSHHSQRGALCMHGWSSQTCRPSRWGLELYNGVIFWHCNLLSMPPNSNVASIEYPLPFSFLSC